MRTILSSIVLAFCLSLGFAQSAGAQAGVTSRPCPYSCRSQGIPKSVCKDWRQGNICYVQDLRGQGGGNPGLQPQNQGGTVTSAPCPYSCQTVGIKKKRCRDWRQGNTCYVEILPKR